MGAISLYRGNLHNVPDVPRRWPMPNHRLSLRDFNLLLRKRSHALSRLRTTTNSNPHHHQQEEEGMGDNDCSSKQQQSQPNPLNNDSNTLDPNPVQEDAPLKSKEIDASASSSGAKSALPDAENDQGSNKGLEEKEMISTETKITHVTISLDVLSDKEKRKRELEKNLHILNEKKHQLVQALKQILNAEEEIKKRNSIQMSGVRATVPLQMEATIDTGSVTRHAIPKISSEGNISGDLEGESEDFSNHNAQGRHFHHMHSISPSAASPLRRNPFQHNMAPLTSRATFVATGHTQTPPNTTGVMASPSRFAPSGHQGHAVNLPPLSVSGAHFTASSPSPAASGGSSVFRDARLTSPSWN